MVICAYSVSAEWPGLVNIMDMILSADIKCGQTQNATSYSPWLCATGCETQQGEVYGIDLLAGELFCFCSNRVLARLLKLHILSLLLPFERIYFLSHTPTRAHPSPLPLSISHSMKYEHTYTHAHATNSFLPSATPDK